jgi:hypothetical protein
MAPGRPWDDALVTTYPGTGVTALPDAVRTRFELDTATKLYAKYADAGGIPVLASFEVPDEALLVARDIVNHMLAARPDIRADIIERGGRVGVIANTDSVIPALVETRPRQQTGAALLFPDALLRRFGLPSTTTTRHDWNRRVDGAGGALTICAEENVLGYPGTAYFGENMLVHQFAHTIYASVRNVDPTLSDELEVAFKEATAKKMYRDARGQRNNAMDSIDEYWAMGTQWWFWTNYPQVFVAHGVAQTVWSPDELERYDPRLYSILARVYADHSIPADVYHGKKWQ